MKFCILMGSPNLKGNTAELLKPFLEELENHNADISYIALAEKNILPCKGCYACQDVSNEYGCILNDDVQEIMEDIISSEYIVLATPIYSWYCTAPMKALLDR